jgi:protein O-GlcNAc transferase
MSTDTPQQQPEPLTIDQIEHTLQLAVAHHEAGRLQEAEQLYGAILQIQPNHPDTNHNLGLLAMQCNQPAGGLPYLQRALGADPSQAHYWLSYVDALIQTGQTDAALQILEQGQRQGLQGDGVDALLMRLESAAQPPEQLNECHQESLSAPSAIPLNSKIKPANTPKKSVKNISLTRKKPSPKKINKLVTLFTDGRYAEAVTLAQELTERFPLYGPSWKILGAAFGRMDRHTDALAPLQKAAALSPLDDLVHFNLGSIFVHLILLEEAEASFRRALEIKPDYFNTHSVLGGVLRRLGRLSEAKACYRKAGELGSNEARISGALVLPSTMGTLQEVLESRDEFNRNLDELIIDKMVLNDPLQIDSHNFFLAYHGLNDRDIQVKVAKYYEQAFPSLLYTAPHCLKPKSNNPRKIRIGFLSKFLYSHSVSLCFSKIIETISLEERFEAALISNNPIDEKTYANFSGKQVHLPNDLNQARGMLADLELDILIYLDIGMEPLSYFLAFSRLAQVQCVMAGHPVTTGISNMDYFISCDLMEPSDADEHYSEQLVRLPKPLFYFPRPTLSGTPKTRHQLGLPENQCIYMVPMKLQKMHPDFDEAIARILQLDNNGTVVLFEDIHEPFAKRILIERFKKTLPSEIQDRIIFLPWLNSSDFACAIAIADVILDPFHFGIGSTAFVLFVTGTPLVTKPGEFMRGRVGTGFCQMLDITECIAKDTEDYAQKAVKIANDKVFREKISAKILQNNAVIYENLEPIEDFISFLGSLTDQWHNA